VTPQSAFEPWQIPENVYQKIYFMLAFRWPVPVGLLQKKKWIDRRWAAGVMMAIAVTTRDYFASCDQPRPLVSLARFPASIT
jgi:hypothetical protein